MNSGKYVVRLLALLSLVLVQIGAAIAQDDDYEAAVAKWTSYENVAAWLESNYRFDSGRLDAVIRRTRTSGPAGLLARKPGATFELKSGYCTDSANFARHALNTIDPAYNAQFVFIKNQYGQPHHWVTGFVVNRNYRGQFRNYYD
jgi:hypothetical protein